MTQHWNTVRVFISSTFRDMHAERDHLVRFVFPRLREELLKRRIHLVDVDLRWGVKSDEDALEVCQRIIDQCRPRFVCLLGGRYGSVPTGARCSITASEVQYAVLDRLGVKEYRYFYFRDPQVTNSIPESAARAGGYRELTEADEIKDFGEEKAAALGQERETKLAALKQSIISAGYAPYIYPARWNDQEQRLVDLEEFGQRVYADLLASVDDEFGTTPMEALDEFSTEDAAVEAFIKEHEERYIIGSRQTLLDTISTFAGSNDQPDMLILTGKSGLGKSALLCKFYRNYFETHPDEIVIPHFVGVSAGSTDLRRILRHFCHILSLAAGSGEELPQEIDQLTRLFPVLLERTATSHRIILIVDALNQLDPTDNAHAMAWLPESLPPGVRVIVSSLEHPALEALRRRAAHALELELQPLRLEDGQAVVDAFLNDYHKKMNSEQVAALLAKPESGSPLYLLVALEELRTLGNFHEITDRIRHLPGEVAPLFLWILKERLSNDPGFRDLAGQPTGEKLIRRFVTLLGVSRHGLTQAEMVDLVDPGDPLGNVAALQRLLRPYLMRRGELLDFYHAQLRQAVENEYLDEEQERLQAHRLLAEYFHSRADPGGQQHWQWNARLLAEIPFHLAHADQQMELQALFSQLPYLAARIATGQVYEQISDFSLAGSPLPAALLEWRTFLQKHAQRLIQHPDMLVALANHEGFMDARLQAGTLPWQQSWLRSALEQMPASQAAVTAGRRVQVTGRLDFAYGRVSALAPQRSILFCIERLGVVRVVDAQTMRPLETVLSIRRERPLTIACAPDGSSLAVFYESGQAELYRCIFDRDEWPARLELVTRFSYLLPEYSDPVVTWHDGFYWFQTSQAALRRVSLQDPQGGQEPLPQGETGELSALLFSGGSRLVALRQGRDTLLLASGAAPLRRSGLELCSGCGCSEQRFALAFSDASLVIYENGPVLAPKKEAHAGMLRGVLGWDGSQLLWQAESGGFMAWSPEQGPPVPVQDNQEVFPSGLQVLPRQWLLRSDGSTLLVTSHGVVAFRLLQAGAAINGRVETFFGGPVWRAVCKRSEEDQWLLERQPLREVLLGHGVKGRLYCAPDGQGQFFSASGYGPGFVFDLATLRPTPLRDCPPGLNVAVGEPEGGCWFIDRPGDIYFADAQGRCRCMSRIALPDVSGAQLVNCDEYLIWYGYSSKFFPETGADAARTFVFFRKHPESAFKLERLGEQFRHPREGLCLALCYAQAARELVTLWEIAEQGRITHLLRVARIDQFLAWHVRETVLTGLGIFRFLQADLSADARYLGVVNQAGEFACLDIAAGRVVSTLAGSSPFTAVARGAGASGPQFWLVEGHSQIYGCTLVERKL